MHLIYSALRPEQENDTPPPDPKLMQCYSAYLAACAKHREHIIEIQKYFPKWQPRFR
ncbi:hypothetical protein [Mucilaginibacter ginsenosidivorans]|uniref:hypothetical protein n=1 Tax=Mucilaginibacter ginsenosidivorans TaxID=398053 RepID=UPI001652A103|nr:hypothetical protein [Mucilaginibacter ginsenosidivorans]